MYNSDNIIFENSIGKININTQKLTTMSQKKASEIKKNINVSGSGVSIKTSNYLKKSEEINAKISEWQNSAYGDFNKYGSIQFKYYVDATTEIINSINELETLEVPESSGLSSFFEYANSYYSQLKEYFQTTLDNESLTADRYNSLNEW